MNFALTATSSPAEPLTMSSWDISELLGCRHDNVKVTIERLAAKGVIEFPATQEIPTATKPAQIYRIGKRGSYVIVAQLSPKVTARLVDRWQELEARAAQPAIPKTFAAALRMAAETQERLEAAEAQALQFKAHLAVVVPKAEAFTTLMHNKKRSLSEVARAIPGVKSMSIRTSLEGVHLYRRAGAWRVYRNGRSDSFFYEGTEDAWGNRELLVTEAGQVELVRLAKAGALRMKKGHTPT